MKSRTKRILFILTAVLVLLPLIQQHLHILPFRELSGEMEEPKKPEMTLKNWLHPYNMQKWSEKYLKQHYGLREPLTRLHNQYLWDFYNYSNQKKFQWIYVSDDNWYFEAQNVREYHEGNAGKYSTDSLDMATKLNQEVWRLYQLQHILDEYDTHLFVLLIPGKEMIYPEHLPDSTPFSDNKQISAYDYLKDQFQTLGINHIDVRDWFLQMKDSVDYLLFPQTGTHWSNLASMYVADSLIRYMEDLGDMKIQHFSIGDKYQKTMEPDDDLEQLLNLIRPLEKAPNYYAETKIIRDRTAVKPTLITIGDSFYWNILNHTPFKKIFKATPYWYYFSSVYFDDPKVFKKSIHEVDLVKKLLDADFVMLSYSSPQLYNLSDGFSKQALLQLCYDDDEMEAFRNNMVQRIKRDTRWYEGLQKRAEKYQVPIDTALIQEASNVIFSNPNAYLPDLRDSIPTKRSSRVTQHSHGIQ